MKLKRATAMIAAVVMVFSLLAGIGIAPQAAAKVVRDDLPKTTGLYKTNSFCTDWDNANGGVLTDKDQNGNTVPVDFEGNPFRYVDQDNPEYLTDGIKNGWGLGAHLVDEFWFDYVDGNKVTHVPASKLKVTHLDGSACPDVTIGAADYDSRIVTFKSTVVEPVLITYTGAKKNNKMILSVELFPEFYTTPERSIDGYISDVVTTVEGKSKDIYAFVTNDGWQEARYRVDLAKALHVSFRDDEKEDDVELVGNEAAEYAKVSAVSDSDPHNMIYKVTITGKKPANGSGEMEVRFLFDEYDVNEGEGNAWSRDFSTRVRVVEGNVFEGAHPDAFGFRNGKIAITDDYCFGVDSYREVSFDRPIYLSYRYTDADGNVKYVTDVKDLDFYDFQWNDETQTASIGEKIPDAFLSSVKVTQPNPDMPVIKVVVPKMEGINAINMAIGYKGQKPDPNRCVRLSVVSWVMDGFYSSAKATVDSSLIEITTDGTKAEKIYYGTEGEGDWLKSESISSVKLVDENGNDFGKKVKFKNAKITDADGQAFKSGFALTIPAGTLSGPAVLTVAADRENNDGEKWTEYTRLLVMYKAPKKGSKITSGDVTYTVTGKNAVSVSKVKASAKSVTIPAAVGALKVTGIAAKAMNGCKKLTKITVKSASIKSVGAGAFKGVPVKAKASVPKAKKAAYAKLFKKGGFKGKVK